MKNQELANRICIRSRVTSEKGSWKWQDAYRVSTYSAKLCDDGLVRWKFEMTSCKYSLPQFYRAGLAIDCIGGMRGKLVGRELAILKIGKLGVKQIENSGWRFKECK